MLVVISNVWVNLVGDEGSKNTVYFESLFFDRRWGWLREPVVISSVWFKLVGDEG